MNWECANPLWWRPRGYALVRVDSRGSGKSLGASEPSSHQEAVDTYDAIEHFAKQPWSNGNVGCLGISYHANFQWRVANLQPPSLKAIMPWEGRVDQYRDQAYHGGIFAAGLQGQAFLFVVADHSVDGGCEARGCLEQKEGEISRQEITALSVRFRTAVN